MSSRVEAEDDPGLEKIRRIVGILDQAEYSGFESNTHNLIRPCGKYDIIASRQC